MLARVCTNAALIDVFVARGALISRLAVAVVLAIDWVGVTQGALPARVALAGIKDVAQQACLARGAMADEGGHPVLTGGACAAGGRGAIVDVLRAVRTAPAVDTYAVVSALDVVACAAILAGIGLQMALIHIVCAVLTCPFGWALTVIGVDSIHTGASILTLMGGAIIDVNLTVCSIESWQAVTLVVEVGGRAAGALVKAGRG